MKSKLSIVFFSLVLAVLSYSPHAHATLGEAADSIARDLKALSATKGSTTRHTGYTIQEIVCAGTTVREYLNLDGVVFAVAWRGRVNPDLTPLLGCYAAEFGAAMRQSPSEHGRRPLTIKTNRLVVETGGHMGDLQGRAFLPALLPEGVSVEDID